MSKNNLMPTIFKLLKNTNFRKRIRVCLRELKGGGYSIYLDAKYHGTRERQSLKLYIKDRNDSKNLDMENIQLAMAIRDKKELKLKEKATGFRLSNSEEKENFLDYFQGLAQKKGTNPPWLNTYKHLHDYTHGRIEFREINEKFCQAFMEYILSKVSRNTALSYLSRFKSALNQAVRENKLTENPSKYLSIKRTDVKREFLTQEEIVILKDTPLSDQEIKNAFLFSCFSGLRVSDIEKLEFGQIQEGYLHFRQQKTKDVQRIKLNSNAVKLIEQQRGKYPEGKNIFQLPSRSQIKRMMTIWIKNSGILKHITFHSGRHTFATLCLTSDIDLYTVSKLLGHRNIQTTQVYAKLIDKKKDEAVAKLPQIL